MEDNYILKGYIHINYKYEKTMNLGECFGNIINFENLQKDFEKRWDKYKCPYAEITETTHLNLTHIHKYFAVDQNLNAHQLTTKDNNGEITHMEISFYDKNNGTYTFDKFSHNDKPKFSHYEAKITRYGHINSSSKSHTSTSNEDICKAIDAINNFKQNVQSLDGAIIIQNENVQEF